MSVLRMYDRIYCVQRDISITLMSDANKSWNFGAGGREPLDTSDRAPEGRAQDVAS
jgi:hypothetical protein